MHFNVDNLRNKKNYSEEFNDQTKCFLLSRTAAKNIGNSAVSCIVQWSLSAGVGSRQTSAMFNEKAGNNKPVLILHVTW